MHATRNTLSLSSMVSYKRHLRSYAPTDRTRSTSAPASPLTLEACPSTPQTNLSRMIGVTDGSSCRSYVYRGRGDRMAQLTWRAVLVGSCLGGVLSLTNLYIGL